MKKWTVDKVKDEMRKGGIPEERIPECAYWFNKILDTISDHGWERRIDVQRIIDEACRWNRVRENKGKGWILAFPESLLKKLVSHFENGILSDEYKFRGIPAKQSNFTLDEAAYYAYVTRRQVEYDIKGKKTSKGTESKLQFEKIKGRIFIQRKNLIPYIREKKRKR